MILRVLNGKAYEGYIADLEELKLLYQYVVDKKYVQTKTEKMKEDDWILVHRPTKRKRKFGQY